MPFVLEGTLLPELGADERGVRECSACPPWAECAHFGDQCVRLISVAIYVVHARLCPTSHARHDFEWGVDGPVFLSDPLVDECTGWDGRRGVVGPVPERFSATTEAEARAEFERRVAVMLGREVE